MKFHQPNRDGRVVKAAGLRSAGAIRVGSIPTPCKQLAFCKKASRANNLVVELQVSNLSTWVRFPLGASAARHGSQEPRGLLVFLKTSTFRYCLTVRMSGFHPGSPGSIPGIGKELWLSKSLFFYKDVDRYLALSSSG